MKKVFIIISVTLFALILSGCSFGVKSTSKQPADGGIYMSTDLGDNWLQKSPGIAQADLRYTVFNPTDDGIIYAALANAGVVKSIDGGNSWATTTLSTGNYAGFVVDPNNADVLYAISGGKIIKSVDAAATWFDTYVEARPSQTLMAILADPIRSNVIYAATTTSIIRSADYGNTWRNMNWQGASISKLFQNHKNPSILYALTNKGIFKSIDGGFNWTDSNSGLATFTGAKAINWLDFDPDSEVIFIGTADSILKSTNGAVDWQEIPTLFKTNKVSIPVVIHDPRNTNNIIFAYSNILQKTDDGGVTWKSFKSIPTTRPITYLSINPFHNDTLFAGTTLPPPPKKKSGL